MVQNPSSSNKTNGTVNINPWTLLTPSRTPSEQHDVTARSTHPALKINEEPNDEIKSLSSPTLTTQVKQLNQVVSPAELIRPSPLLSAAPTAARFAKAISNEPKDPGNSLVSKIKSSYPVPMISPALICQPAGVASTISFSISNDNKGSTKSGSITVAAPAEFAFPVSSNGSSTAAASTASIISQQKPRTVKDVVAHSRTGFAGVSSITASSRPAGLTGAPTVSIFTTQSPSQAVLEKSKDQLRNTSDTPKNTTATASPNTSTGLSETKASRGNTLKISATTLAGKVKPTTSIEPSDQEATRSVPSVQAKMEAAGVLNVVNAHSPNSARAVAAGAVAASFTPQQLELMRKMQQINCNFVSLSASSQATHEEELSKEAFEKEAARKREREWDRRDNEAKEQQQRGREREQRERLEKQQRDAAEKEQQERRQAAKKHFQESLLRYQNQMQQKGTPASSWSLSPSSGEPGTDGPSSHPSRPTLLMPVPQQSGSCQDKKDKDIRERFIAAYNMAVEQDRDPRERYAGPPMRHAPPPSEPYTALPRADMSVSIQGYQTTTSPSSNALPPHQRANELQLRNSHLHLASNAPADYSSKAGSIVGLSDSVPKLVASQSFVTPSSKSPTKSAAVIAPEREHGSDRKRRVATSGSRSQSPSFNTASKRPKSNGSHPNSVVDAAALNDFLGESVNTELMPSVPTPSAPSAITNNASHCIPSS